MIVIIIVFCTFALAFVAGMGIYTALGGGKQNETPSDPYREPGPFKTSLLKMKETFREDGNNFTYCSKCNKHMTPIYCEIGKPSHQYQCMSCRKIITITAS